MTSTRLLSILSRNRTRYTRALSTMLTRGDSTEKLRQLRELMQSKGVDAYIVPSEDAHASEYLADRHKRRAWLTSFTGSAGCAVVTRNEAYCWTDGRYWLQASEELDDNWTLMKAGLPEVPTWGAWLKSDLPKKSKVGIDPHMIPYLDAQGLRTSLATVGSELVGIKDNLIDRIWLDPPQTEASPIFVLDERFAGESLMNKLRNLREELAQTGSPGIVVSMLDEVAWMFNLRGSDIAYNPVFFSYAILTKRDCTLFVSPSAITASVREYLKAGGVAAVEYDKCVSSLESWGRNLHISPPTSPRPDEGAKEGEPPKPKVVTTDKVLIGNKTSWAVAMAVGEDNVEVRRSPIETAKAKKNATEIEGFRQSHIRDGAALSRYFAWLEDQLHSGAQLSEYAAAEKLEAYRKENDLFMGLSFDTISSTGSNGAIIHYSPDPVNSAIIDPSKMYLCDSGAQYLDGTTDTTRTLHFGVPTDEEKRAFTRVLQGHIAIDTAIFPAGTTGYLLDVLARRPLWQDGLDYRHGTSHGVGSFLNVHEGPHGVGTRITYNDVALVEGMVMSNEPGFYCDGKFGIRIENIVVVRRADTPNNFGGKGYLELEHVTMCPIQTSLVELELLAPMERAWLNAYHAEVLERTAPVLERFGDQRALQWLEKACAPV